MRAAGVVIMDTPRPPRCPFTGAWRADARPCVSFSFSGASAPGSRDNDSAVQSTAQHVPGAAGIPGRVPHVASVSRSPYGRNKTRPRRCFHVALSRHRALVRRCRHSYQRYQHGVDCFTDLLINANESPPWLLSEWGSIRILQRSRMIFYYSTLTSYYCRMRCPASPDRVTPLPLM